MSNQFNSKEFKDLNAKWRKKLEKSGFEDIENDRGELRSSDSSEYIRNFDPIAAGAKEEYFRRAGFFLYEYKFETELERRIWELHVEGASIREIVRILKKRGLKKIYKRRIHELLKPMVKKCINAKQK